MKRAEILDAVWQAQDMAFELMTEYDALPHYYGSIVLFQAEAYIVNQIGHTPGITTTELSVRLGKTSSACSQIIKKLIDKGIVVQNRNAKNRRIYNLELTEIGEKVYQDHILFNAECQKNTFSRLSNFTDEELLTALRVQQRINETYMDDVSSSKKRFSKEDSTDTIVETEIE